MRLLLRQSSIDDYRKFLAVKALPNYRFRGDFAEFPDEYASSIGAPFSSKKSHTEYRPSPFLFDYQRDIAAIAIKKQKFAVFADCGLGKTLIMAEFSNHARLAMNSKRHVLIVSPLMVVQQTIDEINKWYGFAIRIRQVRASELAAALSAKPENEILITNYDALNSDIPRGRLGALILDESSMLKSHYGKWASDCLRLGRGLEWKLCCTGTPAPNDRIEYANHAVFLDAFPNVNAFLATFFVNRGQTGERWELKPHALLPFYRAISHWSIFLSRPSAYGWKDNADQLPPIKVHIHDVPMNESQRRATMSLTGSLITDGPGGIGQRAKLASIAKGWGDGGTIPTAKYDFIRHLVNGFNGESTLLWCLYNKEQEQLVAAFPEAASIDGATPIDVRMTMINEFKAGKRKILISKPKILGFGLNLQIATRQVFSGLQDSYESYYQAVKRSNRIGSTRPLNVHIPITEIERPMIETVLKKAAMVQSDTEAQERMFIEHGITPTILCPSR